MLVMDIITSSFTQGAVWSIMAIGVYITFRLLDIADLSAEGVFPLGAMIAAVLISSNVHPIIATIAAMAGGILAGWVAGLIHTKMNIPPLLTGILMLTGLYSINMQVSQGKPNIALLGQTTIYSGLQKILGWSKNFTVSTVALFVLTVIILILWVFLHTEMGLALRATGGNVQMSEANGINTNRMKTLGYMIGNGLIALAGAMVAQKDGFADIGMGIGTIVIGLASIIASEVIFPNKKAGIRFLTIIVGSFVYRLIIDTILNQPYIEIRHTDLRLFSAILLALVLFLPGVRKRRMKAMSKRLIAKRGQLLR